MKHALHDQIVPIDNSAPLAIKLLKEGHAEDLPGVLHGMATTHADVISADLPAFIKGQAAYRSGVLPRSAVQSTAQLNEWFRMTPVYASEGRPERASPLQSWAHEAWLPGSSVFHRTFSPARTGKQQPKALRREQKRGRLQAAACAFGSRFITLYCDLPHLTWTHARHAINGSDDGVRSIRWPPAASFLKLMRSKVIQQ
jgi:hypothetical protein